jgi:hypothetical protein
MMPATGGFNNSTDASDLRISLNHQNSTVHRVHRKQSVSVPQKFGLLRLWLADLFRGKTPWKRDASAHAQVSVFTDMLRIGFGLT